LPFAAYPVSLTSQTAGFDIFKNLCYNIYIKKKIKNYLEDIIMLKNEILTRLQNGENVDAIAQELTDALNAAQDEFQKKEEADAKQQLKINDMQKILDAIYNFCYTHYCEDEEDVEILDEIFEENTAESLIKQLEDVSAMFAELAPMCGFGVGFSAPKAKTKEKTKTKSADETITSFLKGLGL
jgi:hypothetical protein